MPARDANDATWYVLRYPEDFLPRAGAANDEADPFDDEPSPFHEDTLLYDPARHVLELQPEPLPPQRKMRPLRGLAVDVNGEIYKVDHKLGLRVIRCDGSQVPFTCEPQVLARPAGLALDRRGYLYVADPAAHRVVVLLPEDGSVRAVLHHGVLERPVDVAVAPGGRVYVADNATGRIEMFSPRWRHLGGFVAQNGAPTPLPEDPEPIAVMIDADGSVLVADASHPRLLHFEAHGAPLADVALTIAAATVAGGDVALDALQRAWGARAPRFILDNCCPVGTDDAGTRIAAVHRAIRLLGLSLGRRFSTRGVFVSAPLDSGAPAATWHRLELDADLPPGTSITVETLTAGARTPRPPYDWQTPRDAERRPVTFTAERPDALIQSPPGRFLWVRITLEGDGTATPSVRALRVFYPRVSYLALLPPAYQHDPEAAVFLQRFLGLFEHILTGVEDRYEEFSRELNPDAAPREVIDWLAALIDLAFDPSWPLDKRRALVAEAMQLYATRGTPRGIERYVEIYTGVRPVVMESFLERPGRPAFLGRPGAILGCGVPLSECQPDTTPDEELYAQYAHRFRVYAYLDDPCAEQVLVPVIERIVEVNKPSHTDHELCLVYPGAQLGITTSVGIGLVVGAATPPGTPLGGCDPAASPPGGALGVDTVLGERRPFYWRERTEQL